MSDELKTGIFVLDENQRFQELIKDGVELPTQRCFYFSTAVDNQKSIVVDLARFEQGKLTPFVRYLIDDIEPAPRGVPSIEVLFIIDKTNHMTIEVRDRRTANKLSFSMRRYQRSSTEEATGSG